MAHALFDTPQSRVGDHILSTVPRRQREHGAFRVRSLSPHDAAACRAFADHLLPEDLRLRFASPTRVEDGLRRLLLAIERSCGTVLAAFGEDDAIIGVARLVPLAPAEAEIALLVRSDLKGRGVGSGLIGAMIERAHAAGYAAVCCEILYENLPMRRLAAAFDFQLHHQAGSMIGMRLALTPATPISPTAVQTLQQCDFPW